MQFVTIFPLCENVHLLKDVGMLPYTFHKELGYSSKLVCIKQGDYPYGEQYTQGMELEFLKGNPQKAVCNSWYEFWMAIRYLNKHAREIDVLHMFHFSYKHMLAMVYYKFLNQKGKAYLKLDGSKSVFDGLKKDEDYFLDLNWKNRIRKYLVSKMDVISGESEEICIRFAKALQREILLIPNGFFLGGSRQRNVGNNKKKLFLTVGRLGAPEKRTEDILTAFSQIYRECDWDLMLVGPTEGHLLEYLEECCQDHPGLRERIHLEGPVQDKKKLEAYYLQAKVFLLPSVSESFGIVVVEAKSCGCFVIVSEGVSPAKEFTQAEKYGYVVSIKNHNALANAMLQSTKIEIDHDGIQQDAYDCYNWDNICRKLDQALWNQ